MVAFELGRKVGYRAPHVRGPKRLEAIPHTHVVPCVLSEFPQNRIHLRKALTARYAILLRSVSYSAPQQPGSICVHANTYPIMTAVRILESPW